MFLEIRPEQLTPWFLLVTAAGGAIATVAGALFSLRLWWKNRGKDGLKNWVHETSGAEGVRSEVGSVRAEVGALRTSLETFIKSTELESATREHQHTENLRVQERHSIELDAMARAQDSLAHSVKALADEITAASEERQREAHRLSFVEEMAATAAAHARSRRKHPTTPRVA